MYFEPHHRHAGRRAGRSVRRGVHPHPPIAIATTVATTTVATPAPVAAPVGLVAVGLARELRHGQLAALLVLVEDGGLIVGLVHHLLGLLLRRLHLGLVILLLVL